MVGDWFIVVDIMVFCIIDFVSELVDFGFDESFKRFWDWYVRVSVCFSVKV